MTKALRKAIMNRSKLKNIYTKKRTDDHWVYYKNQRNFCVNLLRKTKKDYFQNLNMRNLSSNRKFLKTITLYFSNKGVNSNKFLLKEKGNLVSNKKQLATIMYSLFINITKSLELKEDNEIMQILWKMCWMLSILILVLKELGEPLKLMKNFHFN